MSFISEISVIRNVFDKIQIRHAVRGPLRSAVALVAGLSVLVLTACGSPEEDSSDHSGHSMKAEAKAGQPVKRWYTKEMVNQGKPLYQANCAQCHGGFAQGNPDWRKPTDDGRYLPPPLNGTGHAWHHSLAQTRDVIKNGRGPDVPSDMPAWGSKLSDQEVDAIIAWFQSRWPDEIYQAWARPKH